MENEPSELNGDAPGALGSAGPAEPPPPPPAPPPLPWQQPVERDMRIEFSGSGGEYFRIWIVNLLLTLVTFGIYAAWARVRTRRYFYGCTRVDGDNFDFLGSPVAILRGNLILGGFFILYMVSDFVIPLAASALLGIFYIALPYLIYKATRFLTRYSAWRNVRFGFEGDVRSAYVTYLAYGALTMMTLGLLYPYWMFLRKTWLFSNVRYGALQGDLEVRPGYFYRVYLAVFGIMFVGMVLAGMLVVALSALINIGSDGIESMGDSRVIIMGVSVYLLYVLVYIAATQVSYAWITNYCLRHFYLGRRMRFSSDLSAASLVWIRLSNLFLLIVTVGFAYPWTKVRRVRYILSRITVHSLGPLDDVVGVAQEDTGAIGDSATEMFDIGFGFGL